MKFYHDAQRLQACRNIAIKTRYKHVNICSQSRQTITGLTQLVTTKILIYHHIYSIHHGIFTFSEHRAQREQQHKITAWGKHVVSNAAWSAALTCPDCRWHVMRGCILHQCLLWQRRYSDRQETMLHHNHCVCFVFLKTQCSVVIMRLIFYQILIIVPIARPWGRGIGWFLQVQPLINF